MNIDKNNTNKIQPSKNKSKKNNKKENYPQYTSKIEDKKKIYKNKFFLIGISLFAITGITLSISLPLILNNKSTIKNKGTLIKFKSNPGSFSNINEFNSWWIDVQSNNLDIKLNALSLFFENITLELVPYITIIEQVNWVYPTDTNDGKFKFILALPQTAPINDVNVGNSINFDIKIKAGLSPIDITFSSPNINGRPNTLKDNIEAYSILNPNKLSDISSIFPNLTEEQMFGIDFSKSSINPATTNTNGVAKINIYAKKGFKFVGSSVFDKEKFTIDLTILANNSKILIKSKENVNKISLSNFDSFYKNVYLNKNEDFILDIIYNYFTFENMNIRELISSLNKKIDIIQSGKDNNSWIFGISLSEKPGIVFQSESITKAQIIFEPGAITVPSLKKNLTEKVFSKNQDAANFRGVFIQNSLPFTKLSAIYNITNIYLNEDKLNYFDVENSIKYAEINLAGEVTTTIKLKQGFYWEDGTEGIIQLKTPIKGIHKVNVSMKTNMPTTYYLDKAEFEKTRTFFKKYFDFMNCPDYGILNFEHYGAKKVFETFFNPISKEDKNMLNGNLTYVLQESWGFSNEVKMISIHIMSMRHLLDRDENKYDQIIGNDVIINESRYAPKLTFYLK